MKLISYEFVLIFLPIAYLVYWYILRKPKSKLIFLVLLSYLFYYLVGGKFVFLLLAMSMITYFAARVKWIWIAVVLNLLPLLFFKFLISYASYGFFQFTDLILPLGISYFTFKHIGYLVDVRKGWLEAEKNLIAFLTYSAFFPQLVAGPISSYQDTGAQLQHLPVSLEKEKRAEALRYVIYGLFKKIFIADVLASALQGGMNQAANTGFAWAVLTLLIYVMQLYFDFSGYTDFVLGVGKLFGVSLPENFNAPFSADSPREFWNRWHISVTTWFRNYVFFPLSRSLLIRFGRKYAVWVEAASTILTMVIIGLWHQFTWGFLCWGLYNAVLILIQSWGKRKRAAFENGTASRLFSQSAILLGFSFLMYPEMTDVFHLFANIFGVNGIGQHNFEVVTLAALLMAIFLVTGSVVEAKNLPDAVIKERVYIWGIVAFLCVMFLGNEAITFAYAQF